MLTNYPRGYIIAYVIKGLNKILLTNNIPLHVV